MSEQQVNLFFGTLSRRLDRPARVILTGAGAGALMGSVRPSQDVDFEVKSMDADPTGWERLQGAIQETVDETGIQANYAEEIDRWGAISLMDYRRHTLLYRKFGKLEVRLLEPAYWAIGKLDRCLQSDIQDLVAVLKKQKPSWQRTVRVWGRALRESPRSEAVPLFRKQTEQFLRSHGRQIWGQRFDPLKAIRLFHRHAGIRPP